MVRLKRLARPFEDEEETELEETSETGTSSEPDYSFEGYSVDFLDKVGLMPVARRVPR